MTLSFIWWRTPALSHTHSRRDTVSITQYFGCQSRVWRHALWVAEEGAGWQQRTRRGEALPDKPAAPFNTCVLPVISCVSAWLELAQSATLTPPHPPMASVLTVLVVSTFRTLHLNVGWSERLTCFKSPLWFRLPLFALDDPPWAPEYWPELSPQPTPLTPLGGVGSMARLKVQMIFLHHPPSCLPSELTANDNIREEHNGDPTNNLAPGMKLQEFCAII